MQYTDGEIRRIYKSARNKKKQVSILADLNRCSTGKILDIVHMRKEAGEAETERCTTEPDPEQRALMARLDELDARIKTLEDEYRRTARALMEIKEQ